MSLIYAPSFSKNSPNKIGKGINVSGKNTLISKAENEDRYRVSIADEPIDAKVHGKKIFCVRIDSGKPFMMFGFTPLETFDSNELAHFGWNTLDGVGLGLAWGELFFPGSSDHTIIDHKISSKAKEIVVILDVTNNGKKKEIQFLCDGNESSPFDASEFLNGNFIFPAIVTGDKDQQATTIPIDQLKIRTPKIDELINEYHQQNKNSNKDSFQLFCNKFLDFGAFC